MASDACGGLFDLLYPPRCAVCGLFGFRGLCAACRSAASALTGNRCSRCAIHLEKPLFCPECARIAPVPFVKAVVAGVYEGPLKAAIWRLKFNGRQTAAAPLGEALADRLRAARCKEPDLVVPVPLHPARLCERGFNQSEVVARALCHALGWKPPVPALVRTRKTRSQTTLGLEDRAENVRGAFRASPRYDILGKSVLLLDDILTSMATACECCRALQQAGASEILVAALARTDGLYLMEETVY